MIKFGKFVSANKLLTIYTFMLILIIYGLKLANTSYGMDTNWFIQNPSGYLNYWISIGRFGEVFLKYLFLKQFTNIYLINSLTFILLGLSALYICYLFDSYNSQKDSKNLFIIPSIFVTSQLFLFQYYFVLQNFEFSLAMFLTIAITHYSLKLSEYKFLKKIAMIVLLTMLMTIVIGVYQTFILFFIELVVACLLLSYRRDKFSFKIMILKGIPEIIILLLGIIFYWIVDKLVVSFFHLSHANHSTGMINWLNVPFRDGVNSLMTAFASMFPIVSNTPNIYGYSLLLTLILAIIILSIFVHRKYNFVIITISLLLLIISGLGILIASGILPSPRSMVPQYPFMVCFVFFYTSLITKNKFINRTIILFTILLSFTQVRTASNLVMTEDSIFKEDQRKIQLIYQTIESLQLENKSNYKLMIVGSSPAKNKQIIGRFGDLVGISMFEFGGNYSMSTNIVAIMENMGMSYTSPSQEEYMEYWKNKTSLEYQTTDFGVEVIDNMIIIKVTPGL